MGEHHGSQQADQHRAPQVHLEHGPPPLAAGPEGLVTNARLGLRLSDDEIEELRARLVALVQEFADRPPTPDGTRVGLVTMLHRLV